MTHAASTRVRCVSARRITVLSTAASLPFVFVFVEAAVRVDVVALWHTAGSPSLRESIQLSAGGLHHGGAQCQGVVVGDDDLRPILEQDADRHSCKGVDVLGKDVSLGTVAGDGVRRENEDVIELLDLHVESDLLTGTEPP